MRAEERGESREEDSPCTRELNTQQTVFGNLFPAQGAKVDLIISLLHPCK